MRKESKKEMGNMRERERCPCENGERMVIVRLGMVMLVKEGG